MKRIISVFLSLLLCMSLTVPALAVEDAWSCIEIDTDVDSRLYKQSANLVHEYPYHLGYYEEYTVDGLRVAPENAVFTVKNVDCPYEGIFVYFQTFQLRDGGTAKGKRPDDNSAITIDLTGKYLGGDTVTYLATKPDPNGNHISAGNNLYWRFDDYYASLDDNDNVVYAEDLLLLLPGESVSFTIPNPSPDTIFAVYAGYQSLDDDFSYTKDIVCVFDDEIYEEDPLAKADAAEQSRNPFTDVNRANFFYNAVLWAYENNITTGTSATTFGPSEGCTRAQVMTFLWRAAGCPEPSSTVNPFTDVKESHYFYKAVLWAVEQGITTGTSATTFSPNDGCSYGHVVTFLWRANDKPAATGKSALAEEYPGKWYTNAVAWADTRGLLNTEESSLAFVPDNYAPRCEIVYYLYLLYGTPED